jgi:Cu-processing system permease protein
MPADATLSATAAPAAPAASRWIVPRHLITIARKEIRDSLRNRWFMLYTAAFSVLALALSGLSLAGTGMDGFAGFGRTAASLINLVLLIVPLMGLTAGAASLAGERERGTLAYLLSQPVTRMEVVLGKYLGLALALLGSLALAFGISAAVIAGRSGAADASAFVRLVVLAELLALAMLSLGMAISAAARTPSVALGAAIVLWLALVFLGDLGLMGGTVAFKLQVHELFALSLANPLQVFKLASLESVSASLDVLGPAGLYASRTYGDRLPLIFGAVLAAWIAVPLALSVLIVHRRALS